jgi:hypothetical protein
MDANQHQGDGAEERAADVLVGAAAIKRHLVGRGMPKTTNPYRLKAQGWPIGKVSGDSGSLIAMTGRLDRHLDKIARGPAAA